MTPVRLFHETARGSLHVLRNVPCEDSSISYSDQEGRYYIAAISDGHGDPRCFRSQYGSKIATDIALSSLKEFADFIIKEGYSPSDLNNQQSIIKQLTDTIVARWYDAVSADFHNVELNSEELTLIGVNNADAIPEDIILHIYGATMIAALWLPNMLVLLQQGDGRCVVLYRDGLINQPIPWDDRCINTTTTSLCDYDAAERFRSCVIDYEVTPVAGCYLACDGIEDAYRDSVTTMEGVHTFFKYLSCQLLDMDDDSFANYLHTFLPEFSKDGLWGKSGSGDDCSVAGIVVPEMILPYKEQFLSDVKIYQLTEALFWKNDELNGKKRKYEILKRRMAEAEKKLHDSDAEQKQIQVQIETLKDREDNPGISAIMNHYSKKLDIVSKEANENRRLFFEAEENFMNYEAVYLSIEQSISGIEKEIEMVKAQTLTADIVSICPESSGNLTS